MPRFFMFMRNKITVLLILFIIGNIALAVYGIYQNSATAFRDQKLADNIHLSGQKNNGVIRRISDSLSGKSHSEASRAERDKDIQIDFRQLAEINPDIVVWIDIPGTGISYPILESGTGEPEDYYLKHNIYREYDHHGSLYMHQTYSNPEGFLTIIYGHNMRDGTIFHDLHRFRRERFFNRNRIITIYTKGETFTYQIVSVGINDPENFQKTYTDMDNLQTRQRVITDLATETICKDEVAVKAVSEDDRILKLVTCTDDGEKRLHVNAVLLYSD